VLLGGYAINLYAPAEGYPEWQGVRGGRYKGNGLLVGSEKNSMGKVQGGLCNLQEDILEWCWRETTKEGRGKFIKGSHTLKKKEKKKLVRWEREKEKI